MALPGFNADIVVQAYLHGRQRKLQYDELAQRRAIAERELAERERAQREEEAYREKTLGIAQEELGLRRAGEERAASEYKRVTEEGPDVELFTKTAPELAEDIVARWAKKRPDGTMYIAHSDVGEVRDFVANWINLQRWRNDKAIREAMLAERASKTQAQRHAAGLFRGMPSITYSTTGGWARQREVPGKETLSSRIARAVESLSFVADLREKYGMDATALESRIRRIPGFRAPMDIARSITSPRASEMETTYYPEKQTANVDVNALNRYLEGGGLRGWLDALAQPGRAADEDYYRWQTLHAKERLGKIAEVYPQIMQNEDVQTLFDVATGYGAPLEYEAQMRATKTLEETGKGMREKMWDTILGIQAKPDLSDEERQKLIEGVMSAPSLLDSLYAR